MKYFLTFGVCASCILGLAVPVAAQRGGGRMAGMGAPPASQGALSRPSGGFNGRGPGFGVGLGIGYNRGSRTNRYGDRWGSYGYPWGYSYYIPGYFDYVDSDTYRYDGAPAVSPAPADSAAAPAPQQPVIVNQYFGAQGIAPQENVPQPGTDTQLPANIPAPPQNYYLIAYKDHVIYSALAYWVEDKTLHYVTTQNAHNQASLDLIDLNLTKTLNQSNNLPFTIPGK